MIEIILLSQFVLAFFLGAILGWQREHAGKSAGPRTYGIVSAGACLFTILSIYAFGSDVARVAAGIVTGIGFLGAGLIMRKTDHIEGLTTAAGFWIVAAIGMAVATQFYILAIGATVIIFLALTIDDDRFCKNKK